MSKKKQMKKLEAKKRKGGVISSKTGEGCTDKSLQAQIDKGSGVKVESEDIL